MVIEWAAWGPTIVSIVTAIFIAGMMYGKLKQHDKHLEHHDDEFESMNTRFDGEIEALKIRLGLGEVELAKLQAWRDGYNAAIGRASVAAS